MVMSFSEEQFDNAVSTSWWSTAFFEMLNHIQQITAFAIRNGFLIRGGITRGDLYHSDSIVFGSAMNDAYALESKEAKMPRILISKELAFDLKTDSRNKKYITMDAEDDKFYLDYLPIILSHKTDLSEKIIPLFKVTPMSRPAI
ncbi:MAG: hypothetical protein NTU49_03785 [Gammaproteobacteria bacterium]|nr:hypothetical protein [Gammaproteobacteria bacterium]